MTFVEKHIAFVNDQIFTQQKLADRFAATPFRAERHLHNMEQMRSILSDFQEIDSILEKIPSVEKRSGPISQGVAIKPEDLDGLPSELMAELTLSESDRLEFEITDIIRLSGGILSLDKILIGLYRQTGIIHKRAPITSRLYRMIQKNVLYSVEGKKGFYATRQFDDQELTRMFIGDQEENDGEIPSDREVNDLESAGSNSQFIQRRLVRRRSVIPPRSDND